MGGCAAASSMSRSRRTSPASSRRTPRSARRWGKYGCAAFAASTRPSTRGRGAASASGRLSVRPRRPTRPSSSGRRATAPTSRAAVGLSAAEIARGYDVCRDCDVGLHCLFQRRSDTSYKALLTASRPRARRGRSPRLPRPPDAPRAFLESCGGDVYHDPRRATSTSRRRPEKATGADGRSRRTGRAVGLDAAFAAVITVTWRALGVAGIVARASAYGYDQRCMSGRRRARR